MKRHMFWRVVVNGLPGFWHNAEKITVEQMNAQAAQLTADHGSNWYIETWTF